MAKESLATSETVLERVTATRETDVRELWQNLFAKISTFSSHQIQRFPKGQIDEQDITSSVFASLIRGCREGQFSEVSDYEECLRLLRTMAKRKIVNRVRYLTRKKRSGSGHVGAPFVPESLVIADEIILILCVLDVLGTISTPLLHQITRDA